VDIIIGTQNLTDTFEWDLNSAVTPEEFAANYVMELGLSGEFALVLLVSHRLG
jgi:SWI/SNF-related matrix-associated actin-dependent regulator of chromatin subfamily B protein 1